MNKFLAITFLIFSSMQPRSSWAQNLVIDGSFEDHYNEPFQGYTLEYFLKDWYSYFTTPDLIIYPVSPVSVLPPRTGHCMVGGYTLGYFGHGDYNREYLQGNLSEPLKQGSWYYAEGYVRPLLQSPVIIYGARDIGFAFTNKHYTTIESTDGFMIPEIPQVKNQGDVITDTMSWTKISGCFQATGGENKIIIGNFEKDENTIKKLIPGAFGNEDFSYYYFDDISLVEVSVSMPHDTIICRGSAITLYASAPSAISYIWNTGARSPDLEVSAPGIYTVTVTTAQGCVIKGTSTVQVKHCVGKCADPLLPDAFTPNYDGHNDYFRVINPDNARLTDLKIYNRWGELVYYSIDGYEGWDGTAKGKSCDAGTYFYMLRYKDCQDGSIQYGKGSLTLIR